MVYVVRKYRRFTWNEIAISTGGLTRHRCLLKPLAGSSPKDSSKLKSHCDFTFNLWDKAITFGGYTSRRKLLCGGQMGSALHGTARMWPCHTPATQLGCSCSALASSQLSVDWCSSSQSFYNNFANTGSSRRKKVASNSQLIRKQQKCFVMPRFRAI